MLVNIIPLYTAGGVTAIVGNIIPIGSLFVIMTVAIIAFGELFKSAKMYEYIASFAPKGQEGLFQGYSNLPMALGSIAGGFIGAYVFNEIMCKDAVELPNKLLELNPTYATIGWAIFAACGFLSALSMFIYNWWIRRDAKNRGLAESQ
jgi:hypothetical protein